MIRIFYDVETSGLDFNTCSIVQLAGFIIKDGKEVYGFNYKIKPYRGELMSEDSARINGISNEIAYSYPDQKEAWNDFISVLDSLYDVKKERAYLVGYNNFSFDDKFLRAWFEYNGNTKFGWYFYYPSLDVMHMAAMLSVPYRNKLYNFKLSTLYQYIFKRPLKDAHDAMIDIEATKEIFDYFYGQIYKVYMLDKDPQT